MLLLMIQNYDKFGRFNTLLGMEFQEDDATKLSARSTVWFWFRTYRNFPEEG